MRGIWKLWRKKSFSTKQIQIFRLKIFFRQKNFFFVKFFVKKFFFVKFFVKKKFFFSNFSLKNFPQLSDYFAYRYSWKNRTVPKIPIFGKNRYTKKPNLKNTGFFLTNRYVPNIPMGDLKLFIFKVALRSFFT